ncbi:aryl hydrocarbon receptor nuclear translocator-like protein 2 [Chanos chanos]|uniref:Aryl hydrocarbon receptor nuclear translocator-like protein 2 n=1 Tax=Chanos chanos TaxID=29144 RepID=A0A6J2UTJ8_CHACN|nr:aryl hydrocarbon receptor nuclear translocator-like protein 2 [Chanos chanos]
MSAGRAVADDDDGAARGHTGAERSTRNISVSPPDLMMTGSSHSLESINPGPSQDSGLQSSHGSNPRPLLPGMDVHRKRKGSTEHPESSGAVMEDSAKRTEGDEQQAKIKCLREPHSQIEKRRRDKMNNLIDELSAMIPSCNPLGRKLDRLTVLRKAVQHLKSLKGTTSSLTEAARRPSFLPEDELRHLLLRAADGFLFVVSCDRGKILFVSDSISKILHYNRLDLIGQSVFDYIHPKDITKVKEQLSSSELFPQEQHTDTKSGSQMQGDLPHGGAQLCTGARRSFFCRMKQNRMKSETLTQPSTSKRKDWQRYCTVHCTGYMRSWDTSQLDTESEDLDKHTSQFNCLVAIGRIHSHSVQADSSEVNVKPAQFVTRYTIDGKFTFVDQRATTVLGYLPQELLGTSCYEYFHQDNLPHLADKHRKVLHSTEKIETDCYRFRTKQGSFITLQSQWFSFRNPWTKEVEFIVSTNTVVSGHSHTTGEGTSAKRPEHYGMNEDKAKPSPSIIPTMRSTTGTMIYASNIGTQIANELLDFNRITSPPSSSPPTALQGEVEEHVEQQDQQQAHLTSGMDGNLIQDESSHLDLERLVSSGLSNDEAAMAVIMSFLETDSNLSQTSVTDLGDMHWPL